MKIALIALPYLFRGGMVHFASLLYTNRKISIVVQISKAARPKDGLARISFFEG